MILCSDVVREFWNDPNIGSRIGGWGNKDGKGTTSVRSLDLFYNGNLVIAIANNHEAISSIDEDSDDCAVLTENTYGWHIIS